MSSDPNPITALAIQGGAMRSIYCVGAVRALLETGSLDRLGRVHVSSAGCVAALLLLESNMDVGRYSKATAELLDLVAGPRFINRRRLWRMVDVAYLVESMFKVTGTSAAHLRQIGIPFEV